MEFKGTKGVWIIEDNGKSVYSEDRDKNIAFDGQICRLHTGLNTYDNNIANAKLIACAPEFLNELQNIIKEYDLDIVQGIDARKIRELIKKATTI